MSTRNPLIASDCNSSCRNAVASRRYSPFSYAIASIAAMLSVVLIRAIIGFLLPYYMFQLCPCAVFPERLVANVLLLFLFDSMAEAIATMVPNRTWAQVCFRESAGERTHIVGPARGLLSALHVRRTRIMIPLMVVFASRGTLAVPQRPTSTLQAPTFIGGCRAHVPRASYPCEEHTPSALCDEDFSTTVFPSGMEFPRHNVVPCGLNCGRHVGR